MSQDMNESKVRFQSQYVGDKLKKIRAKNGGSIMDMVKKAEVTNTPTLIVGLGGLGGKTVNAIKEKYIESISDKTGKEKKIHFLALDTAKTDVEGLLESNDNGYLTNDEIGAMLVDTINTANVIPNILVNHADLPMKKWIDYGLPPHTTIDLSGAQGVRQIGRLILSKKNNYNAVYEKLKSKFDALRASMSATKDINVILVAGISGGTGSGTIVDISYMIHLVQQEIGGTKMQFDAILYTPEVQGNVGADLNLLKRNFTAAMKEIDSFFKASDTRAHYTFHCEKFTDGIVRTTSGVDIGKGRNIFDSCTLVQGFDSVGGQLPLVECINTVANYVANFISNSKASDISGVSVQVLASVLSNEFGNSDSSVNTIKANHLSLPRDTYYKYRAIGFKSLSFPVEAIMTILANKTTEALIHEFDKDPMQTAQTVLSSAQLIPQEGIQDKGQAFDAILRLGVKSSPINEFTFKDIKECDSYTEITNRFVNSNSASRFDVGLVDRAVEHICVQIKNEMEQNGPYASLRLSQRVCEYLIKVAECVGDVDNFYKDQINRGENVISKKFNEIKNAGLFTTGKQQMTTDFNSALKKYVVLNWKYQSLPSALQAFKQIHSRVLEQNNNVWDYYVGAFNSIADVLKDDSAALVETAVKQTGNNQVFSADMLNLADVKDVSSNLYSLIDHYLTPDRVKKLTENLIADMLRNQDAWCTTDANKFAGTDKLRELFKEQFKEFAENQIEKFMIVQYSSSSVNIDELLEELDKIDNAPPNGPDPWETFETNYVHKYGSESPLEIASREIYNKAISVGACAFTEHDLSIAGFNDLYTYNLLCLMQRTPHISKKIQDNCLNGTYTIPNGFSATRDIVISDSPEVFCIQVYCGVPLYFFKGMSDNQEKYAKAINSGLAQDAGLHMDASKETAWKYFPPIVNNDALRELDHSDGDVIAKQRIDYKDEEKFLQKIKSEAITCMDYGTLQLSTDNTGKDCYKLYYILDYSQIDTWHNNTIEWYKNFISQAIDRVPDIRLSEKDLKSAWDKMFSEEVANGDSLYNAMVNGGYVFSNYILNIEAVCSGLNLTDLGDDNRIGDLYKIIRRSTEFRNQLSVCYDEYTKLNEEMQKIKDELVTQARNNAIQKALKKVQVQKIEWFVYSVLTNHVQIEYDANTKNLSSYFLFDLSQPSNFETIIDQKMVMARPYERDYYIYGLFTCFLKHIDSLSADDWSGYETMVRNDFANNFDGEKFTPIAKKLVCDITGKDITFPVGPSRQRFAKELNATFEDEKPQIFDNLAGTSLNDIDAVIGNSFAGQVMAFYDKIKNFLKSLDLDV